MAWNEPGNQNDRDPWGGGNKGDQGPPDLDEVVRNLQSKLGKIFGGGKGSKTGKTGGGQGTGPLVPLVVIGVVILLLINAVFTVDEQERAVVLRLGKYDRTETPGLRFKIPLVEQVIPVNVTMVRNAGMKELMLTEDENVVEIELNVQYRISDPVEFALRVEDPPRSLEHSAESALRHNVGSTELNPIMTTGREIVALQTRERLQAYMDRYSTGIEVLKVNIKQARAPIQVQAAFDDVQKAKLDKERYGNEAEAYANRVVPESRGKAQRMLEEANAYKSEVIARAEGEAFRFTKLLQEYEKAPVVTRERLYLDTLQAVLSSSTKIMVDVEGGNNLMYLPLDKLTEAGVAPSVRGGAPLYDQRDLEELTNQVIEKIRERQAGSRREGR